MQRKDGTLTYDIEWRYDEAAKNVFKTESRVSITYAGGRVQSVVLENVKTDGGAYEAGSGLEAPEDNNGNIVLRLKETPGYAVMSEWQDLRSGGDTWVLYGEILAGDPNGVGGFGGQGGTGG